MHAISSPLAEQGISILFLSTYSTDYILVPLSHLSAVTSTLERSGFEFRDDDGLADDASASDRRGSVGALSPGLSEADRMRRSFSYSSHKSRRGDSASTRRSGSAGGGNSLSNSLVLSEASSTGASATLSRSESAARAHPAPPIATPGAEDGGFDLPPGALSLLSDELINVGLAAQAEHLWRDKVVQALFFPERVLRGSQGGAEGYEDSPLPGLRGLSLDTDGCSPARVSGGNRSRQRGRGSLLRDAFKEQAVCGP